MGGVLGLLGVGCGSFLGRLFRLGTGRRNVGLGELGLEFSDFLEELEVLLGEDKDELLGGVHRTLRSDCWAFLIPLRATSRVLWFCKS